MRSRLRTDVFPQQGWDGVVSAVNSEVDVTTRNVRVRATFPNTDGRYKGISSLVLLRAVADQVRDAGWEVVNVDAMLLAERPRIRPYVVRMRARIAEALRVTLSPQELEALALGGHAAVAEIDCKRAGEVGQQVDFELAGVDALAGSAESQRQRSGRALNVIAADGQRAEGRPWQHLAGRVVNIANDPADA